MNRDRCSAVLALLVWLLVGLGAPVCAGQGPTRSEEAAERFLDAMERGDLEEMRCIARAERPQAWLLANLFLGSYLESDRDPLYLEAARRLARHAAIEPWGQDLSRWVEAWAGAEQAELKGEARLRAELHRYRKMSQEERIAEISRLVEELRDPIRTVPWSFTAGELLVSAGMVLGEDPRQWPAAYAMRREGIERFARWGWDCTAGERAQMLAFDLTLAGRIEPGLELLAEARRLLIACATREARHEAVGTFSMEGLLMRKKGRFQEALEAFDHAAEESRRHEAPRQHGRALFQAGYTHLTLGEMDLARNAFQGSYYWFAQAGMFMLEDIALQALGNLAAAEGRYAEALNLLEEALVDQRARNYGWDAALCLRDIAEVQIELGRLEEAAEALEETIAYLEGRNDLSNLSEALMERARIEILRGRLEAADRWLDRASSVYDAMGDPLGRSRAALRSGDLRAAEGRHDLALERYREAADLLGKTDTADPPRLRWRSGRSLHHLGEPKRGRALLEGALPQLLGRERVEARLALAEVSLGEGRFDEAIEQTLRAARRITVLGRGLGEEEAGGLREIAHRAADLGIRAALRGDAAAEEAYELIETARAVLLAESLVNRRALLAAHVPRELRQEDLALRSELRARQAELVRFAAEPGTRPGSLKELRRRIGEIDAALAELSARIARQARRDVGAALPEITSLEHATRLFEEDEALLLYHLGEQTAAVLLLRPGSVALAPLGEPDRIVNLARAWSRLLSTPGASDRAVAAELYGHLIAPVAEELSGVRRLLVSPEGPLSFLPFEALVLPSGERLVARYETVYTPSTTTHAQLQGEGEELRVRAILALGDPVPPGAGPARRVGDEAVLRGLETPLPASKEEVEAVAALFPAGSRRILLGERATGSALREGLEELRGEKPVVHLATHGHLDMERPKLSGLVLSRGEVLNLHDIYHLRTDASLVVLSACETGRGRLLRGEGVVGLVRGFFQAGAPRVVVSNWKVRDDSTRDLMVRFHRFLVEGDLAPAAALRRAKLAVLEAGGEEVEPYEWAGFVLWGLPE